MLWQPWLLAWLLLLPPAAPEDNAPATELLAQGDKLADQGQYTEALLRYKAAYEKILPVLRGLDFVRPVSPEFMQRSDLQGHMQKIFEQETSADEMRLSDASLKAFGFVPPEFKTEETMLSLLSEEVAGFYDPKSKEIFLIREPPPATKPGLLARLLGASGGFNKDEHKATLAHEMTHALDDQHFDLDKLEDSAKGNDDQALALHALVEGEATLVMLADMTRGKNGDGRDMLKSSPAAMDVTLRFLQGIMPFAGGKTFRNAPAIFRETMLFSYFKGIVFVLHLTNADEWESVNRAFREPPRSTEQILHPEKYLEHSDEPVAVTLPPLGDAAGEAWQELGQNVLGEFQITILLKRHWGTRAAAGWGGDRYAVFAGPDDKLGLAWFTTWDTPEDAAEFAGAYARYMGTKLDLGDNRPAGPNEPSPPAVPDRFRLEHAGRTYAMVHRNNDVVVVEGFSDAETERLVSAVLKAQKGPRE